MRIEVSEDPFGAFHCSDDPTYAMMSALILRGHTYPDMNEYVRDVRVVVDVGANVGAASRFFATRYQNATVYALEPAVEPFRMLLENTKPCPNVRCFRIGLFGRDVEVPLFHGAHDSSTASIVSSTLTTDYQELVRLRAAKDWVDEQGFHEIDVLKLDTEGCEVPILESLAGILPNVRVVHVEYHSEGDRRQIDDLLEHTHVLASGQVLHPHRGEFTYLHRDLMTGDSDYRITFRDLDTHVLGPSTVESADGWDSCSSVS